MGTSKHIYTADKNVKMHEKQRTETYTQKLADIKKSLIGVSVAGMTSWSRKCWNYFVSSAWKTCKKEDESFGSFSSL